MPQGFTLDSTLFNLLIFINNLERTGTEIAKMQQPQIFRWVNSKNYYDDDTQKDRRQPDDWLR